MSTCKRRFAQCFAPWDSKKGVPGSNGGFPGFHMAHFIQNLNHVWVCDSGKIGAFYLMLARLQNDGGNGSAGNGEEQEQVRGTLTCSLFCSLLRFPFLIVKLSRACLVQSMFERTPSN